MRRYISIPMACMIAFTAALPAEGAMRAPAPAVVLPAAETTEQVGDRYRWGNRGHWRPRHHFRRHHGFFPRHGGFYFNFPFPRPYAYYHRRPRCHDLVLGYDGRWHCYRGW
jgi:hypothetical protein